MNIHFFGVNIKVSFLFAAILCLMIFTDRTGLILPSLIAVTIHEFAHLFFMKKFSCAPKEIALIPGSIMIVNSVYCEKRKENIILIAGPLSNIILFIVFYVIFLLTQKHIFLVHSATQLIIGCFNLLPAKSLDGGALLYNILTNKFSIEKSEILIKAISFITAFIFLTLGLLYIKNGEMNFSLFILAIYILIFTIIKN